MSLQIGRSSGGSFTDLLKDGYQHLQGLDEAVYSNIQQCLLEVCGFSECRPVQSVGGFTGVGMVSGGALQQLCLRGVEFRRANFA
jgi:hypothetical protein